MFSLIDRFTDTELNIQIVVAVLVFQRPSYVLLAFVVISRTGREWLIRSHSSARFCFELSGNSN